MSQDDRPLSFGATTVADLLTAVRASLAPGQAADWDRLAVAIEARAAQSIRDNGHLARDEPGRQWLALSSLLLGAYRELQPLVDGPRLIAIFLDAMAAPFRQQISGYLEARFGISEAEPQASFQRVTENFQRRGEQRFGAAFRYAPDVQDDRRNFVNIERCFFNDFFRANQAPEVTRIFCELDKVWADALERQPRYGVRFERPTTLANGDDACRFQFHKIVAG